MDAKLTLSLDKEVIENAKSYARTNNISLSRLIESYLSSLIETKTDSFEITPLVKSLSGVITLTNEIDVKKEYSEFLSNKYK